MDKKNNNILKQYKKKYTTKDRLDMSKGGRVGYQRGGPRREELNLANKSLRSDTVQPRMTNDLPKFIPGQPTVTRRGAVPTPPKGKLNQVSMVEGNPLAELSQAEKNRRQKLAQARIDANKKLMEQNPLKPVIQNLDNQRIDSPKPIQPIPKDRVPPKQPPMSVGGVGGGRVMTGREELELANESLRKAPTTGKGSDQMFIGRTDQETRTPQPAQAQTAQAFQQAPVEPKRPDVIQPTAQTTPYTQETNMEKRNTNNYNVRDGEERDPNKVPPGQRGPGGGTPPYTPPYTPPGETPYVPVQGAVDPNRTARVQATGEQAERIAAGDFTGVDLPTIPDAQTLIDPETGLPAESTELDPASEAFKMQQTQAATAAEVAGISKEQVSQGQATTAQPTQVADAAQITEDELTTVSDKDVAVDAAEGQVTREAKLADQTLTERAVAADISDAEAAKGMAQKITGTVETKAQELARRTAEEVGPIDDATAKTRQAQIISEKQKTDILANVTGEGVDLNQIPQYEIAKQRTAQVAEATTKIAQELGEAPSEDAAMRAGITSDGVAKGNAAQIGGVPTLQAASRQAVTKEARKTAAADMLAVVGEMPEEITAAILEDPATVEAQMDTQPVNVQAAVAALPQEALVSTQMEGLLAGIEENKTPVWARPAVDAVNAMMAQRGMTASTVGRDALFNAIIQSALPIAQSNAQALQQRASQNLSNEQQANLQQANQVMQQRMTNLSNQQTAASQTAQMAQQIVLKQGEFDQQAVMTTAQQEQQVRMTNIQNEQQRAVQESAQRQQVAIANLDIGTKLDLANLEQLNAAGRDNLNAEQQTRLTEYQTKVARETRQAELNQRMEEVNLDSRLKIELSNLSELNNTNRASMSNDQQMRLANLNVLVDFKKTNASLAQQMDMANMSAENQIELANLQERASADSANFTEENKFRLQELTTTASVLSQNAELQQRAELAKLGAEEKITLANLTAKNQADSESMTAENQIELANLNKRMAAAQTNAQLAQQLGLAELSNDQQTAMFNAQIGANMDMANFNAEQQRELANSKFMQTVTVSNFNAEQQAAMQNATAMAGLDLANLSTQERLQVENAKNFLTMDMANLSNEQQTNILKAQQEQQRLLSDQSAQNAAAQFNATSENQTNQFMANLAQSQSQFNASQMNSMEQFNKQALNVAEARRVGNEAEAAKLEAQLKTDVSKFNSQMEAQREEFNTKNETAIAQSNVAWRRQANTADTAAQNAVNQQNAQNAFGLTASSMNFLWQELRDEADFNFRRWDNDETRKTSIYTAALGNDTGAASDSNWSSNLTAISSLINGWLD